MQFNHDILLKLIDYQGYNIEAAALKIQLLSDPEQNLQSYSNTCEFFNVKHAELTVPKEALHQLPDHFIAQVTQVAANQRQLGINWTLHFFNFRLVHYRFSFLKSFRCNTYRQLIKPLRRFLQIKALYAVIDCLIFAIYAQFIKIKTNKTNTIKGSMTYPSKFVKVTLYQILVTLGLLCGGIVS
jgi:hypothetical protein